MVPREAEGSVRRLAAARATAFQQGPERHVQRASDAARAPGKFLMFFDADMEPSGV